MDANTGAAREFQLTIAASSAGNSPRTVTIRQAESPPVLEISAGSARLGGGGGRVTLQVRNTGYGAMEWTASLPNDVDWAYFESGETGTDSGAAVVRFGINGGADRELEITVSAPTAANSPQKITLSQPWVAAADCSFSEARAEVLDIMKSWYYFNDESEQQAKYRDINAEDYNSLDEMLNYLRWMPETRDHGFTHWMTKEEYDMRFLDRSVLFGFHWIYTVDDNENPLFLRVLDVYHGSPAGDADFQRGDKIVGLNGNAIEEMTRNQIDAAFGPNPNGVKTTFELEKLDGRRSTHILAKRPVGVATVPARHTAIFDTAKGKVGYLHFRAFSGNAAERLLDEFARFNAEGAKSVILDFRYNQGGNLGIAYAVATLAGGPELFGKFMVETRHNTDREWHDSQEDFNCIHLRDWSLVEKCQGEGALRGLENIVFITGSKTASASELVISALHPYKNVTLVGERTYGRPTGRYLFGFCRREQPSSPFPLPAYYLMRLATVSFAMVNAAGSSGSYEGMEVDCEVADDWANPLGDPAEGRIAAALRFIATGSCGGPAGSLTSLTPRSPVTAVMEGEISTDTVTRFIGD